MKMIATLFVVFALASAAFGECPVPATTPSADIGKIAGRWYEIAGPTKNLTCMTWDYTLREDGNFNNTILSTLPDGSKDAEYMLAERADDQNLLNLYAISHRTPYPITFYIADTDYDSYLAAYTCVVVPWRSDILSGLILSRNNTMDAEKYAELTELLVNKVGVSSDVVGPITQKDCKYWPVPQ